MHTSDHSTFRPGDNKFEAARAAAARAARVACAAEEAKLAEPCAWSARVFVAQWLERQARAGRSRRLVPELLALEAALRACCEREAPEGCAAAARAAAGPLRGLVGVLRWGVGEFWAPRYDAGAEGAASAKALLAANLPVTSALHGSAAAARLGRQQLLRMPLRVAAGATIHALLGHGGDVYSVGFSADGARIVSGSGDKSVRVWDAATGARLQAEA